mgnify:FL=1
MKAHKGFSELTKPQSSKSFAQMRTAVARWISRGTCVREEEQRVGTGEAEDYLRFQRDARWYTTQFARLSMKLR